MVLDREGTVAVSAESPKFPREREGVVERRCGKAQCREVVFSGMGIERFSRRSFAVGPGHLHE